MTTITPAIMAKPRPRPRIDRRQLLLDTIRTTGGRWTTGRVKALYARDLPTHIYRSTIRRDLRELCNAGHLVAHGPDCRRYYTLRVVCRCGEPGADPYACEAEPQDCTGHFPELDPFAGARPVNEPSAEVSRKCLVCGWRTSIWHVDDGSADAELHDHVGRVHGGRHEEASA